jgi:hypothetical protein
MPFLKFSISATEEHLARQVSLKQGTSLAEVARRALQQYVSTAAAHTERPEAVVDQLERRNGSGKKITAAYLSPPLATAIRRHAAEQRCSQSHVVRDLLRNALRARGLLPNKAWGAADSIGAGEASPDQTNAQA